jgi:hypothetical protein
MLLGTWTRSESRKCDGRPKGGRGILRRERSEVKSYFAFRVVFFATFFAAGFFAAVFFVAVFFLGAICSLR